MKKLNFVLITKIALILGLKPEVHENRRFSVPKGKLSLRVFNHAIFGTLEKLRLFGSQKSYGFLRIENCRTKALKMLAFLMCQKNEVFLSIRGIKPRQFSIIVALVALATIFLVYEGGYFEEIFKPSETHEGDLVISNEKYVIEDKTIYLKGSLIVKNSTLIIRNSEIKIMQEFFGQYWIEITENSEFIVENSVLERQGKHNTLLMVRDGSKAVIKNTKSGWDISSGQGEFFLENYDARTAANGIFFQGNNITAINSKFNIISIQNIAGNQKSTLNFDGLKKGFIKNLTIERENKILRLQDTNVERWVIDVGEPVNPNFIDVSIKNSEIWGLWIWFYPGSYVEISNLKPGLYKEWKMSQKFRLENISYDIELENTNIEMFKLQIVGKAKVENCSGIQVATRANASVYIKDSIIEVNLILRGNEEVVLENSAVKGGLVQFIEDRSDLQFALGRGGNPHVLELRGARIEAPLEIAANYTKIKGEGVFSNKDVNWVFGIVEREYPVLVQRDDKPLSEVSLSLVGLDGSLLWQGTTNEKGNASFSINFTKDNYKEKFLLKGAISNNVISKEIEFLTDTPIVFYD